MVYAVCYWNNWNTGILNQLYGTLEHWNNRNNKKVVVDSVGKMYGGCGLIILILILLLLLLLLLIVILIIILSLILIIIIGRKAYL